jgi:hypothetical protein
MACIQLGICAVGTMALETKANANSTTKPNEAADSGPSLGLEPVSS